MIRVLAIRAQGAHILAPSQQALKLFLPEESVSSFQGRSAYLCAQKACFEIALKRKSLSRALKCALPSDIVERLADYVSLLTPHSSS